MSRSPAREIECCVVLDIRGNVKKYRRGLNDGVWGLGVYFCKISALEMCDEKMGEVVRNARLFVDAKPPMRTK